MQTQPSRKQVKRQLIRELDRQRQEPPPLPMPEPPAPWKPLG